jgi:hypothetical protein
MDILFVSFGELTMAGGAVRSISILRALADAGHRVGVVAAQTEIPAHPNIRMVAHGVPRRRLRMAVIRETGRLPYDILHAIDDAVTFVSKVARIRKIRFVYEASRCFSGSVGIAPSWPWRMFPTHFQRLEKKMLQHAAAVLVPCSTLASDLRALERETNVVQIEDVPAQALFAARVADRGELLSRFDGRSSSIVVCCILPGCQGELRKLLMAARKVIEAIPTAAFCFKGSMTGEAEGMAANLDILGRCTFFAPEETEAFLSALDLADAALLVVPPNARYVHPEVFSLLRCPAPVVAVQSPACGGLLTDQNSIQVLPSSESISEGVLRGIQEPLFSLAIAMEGQQLVAERYSYSSFKHKVRMAYHEVLKKE